MDLLHFDESEGIPNNPELPVVIHYEIAEIVEDPAVCERLFAGNGWRGSWRNGIFPYHHFHSNAHEALGIVRGSARVVLGGPGGAELTVKAGNVIVLPAGTGHMRADGGVGLLVVGAYPPGQEDYDLRPADPGWLTQARANIAAVRLPDTDPALGSAAGLRSVPEWRGE